MVWLTSIAPGFAAALPPIQPARQTPDAPRRLQLAVFVNGEDQRLIEPFTFDPIANRLSAKRSDLQEAGIRTPPGDRDQTLFLDALGVAYAYDEPNQKIGFTLTDAQRLPKIYDAQIRDKAAKAQADFGALLNYSLLAGTFRDFNTGKLAFSGANAQLDARVFGDFGMFEQSAVAGSTVYVGVPALLRLDSTFSFSDQETAVTYRAGDVISGGTAWTRSIRLGGAQVARDFALRSDIVTRPLPQIAGTAATPSTVDVLVNGLHTYSQSVGAGPYSIVNIPLIAAGGQAQVVIRDSTGRTVQQTLTLFNAPRMLAPTLNDFSVEFGLARRNYGALSMDYDLRPIGSGTFRYGALPWLTLESHAEGGAGLGNAGVGALVDLGPFGVGDFAFAGSRSPHGVGGQIYSDWQLNWRKLGFSLGAQRTLANYDDLASVTADVNPIPIAASLSNPAFLPFTAPATALADLRPPRELERAAISFPLFDDKTSFSLGAVNLVQQNRSASRLLIGSLSRPLGWSQSQIFVSASTDLGVQKSYSIVAGISFTLSNGVSGSVGATYDAYSHAAATADVGKAQQPIDGTGGWHVRANAGAVNAVQADGSYRTSVGQISGNVLQAGNATLGNAQVDGSVAWIGGKAVAGNKVDGGFALVDAGAPGVVVTQDNHPVGKTDGGGKYLLPNLRAYEPNHIGIDSSGMPVDFDVTRTDAIVTPRGKSGVYLNFNEAAHGAAAIVVFTDAAGAPLNLGAKGHLEGASEPFFVGRDGRAYVRGLAASNVAIIEGSGGECRASFAFAKIAGRQSVVRGVVCR